MTASITLRVLIIIHVRTPLVKRFGQKSRAMRADGERGPGSGKAFDLVLPLAFLHVFRYNIDIIP